MKRKLDKAQFDALPDALKAHYKLDGDTYVLQLETSPDDDPAELRRARDREKIAAKESKDRADAAEKELNEIKGNNARKNNDLDGLEKSYKEKIAAKDAEHKTVVEKLTAQLKQSLVHDKAVALAAKIAGDNAELLVPHIERRLQADLEGAEPITRVLGADGKLSAATIDDLEKEFVANTKFSAIIVANRASGGAGGEKNKGKNSAVLSGKKFSELTEKERVEWAKADPEAFKEAQQEHLRLRRM